MADTMLQTGHVVKDKWKVLDKIGQGAFGEVYKCKDFTRNKQVALKLVSKEKATASQLLKVELRVLKELQGESCFPKFVGFGKTERFDYLVMELLGPSLSELKKHQPERKFSLSTTLRLGYMMLKCIHSIHKAGYMHRDIKPSNFTIGIGDENQRKVYLLDFGFARRYVLENGEVRPPRHKVSFHGTPRYASLRVLQGKEAGRQDDLMSLFYALSEFAFKDLPWKNIRDYREMAQAKEAFDHEVLVKEFPDEFQDFYKHISELTIFDKPDYELLYSVFDRCIKRRGVKDTDPFDFEEDGNTQVSKRPRKCSTSSLQSKSLSEVLITNCASYEESEKLKEKEPIKRSKSTSNNLNHLVFTSKVQDIRKDQLLRSKSSNNMMNKKNQNSFYNNSKDTGFSISPFSTNSHNQRSVSISTQPDIPAKKITQNGVFGEAQVKTPPNPPQSPLQSESLFMDSPSRGNFSFDNSKADNSSLRHSLSSKFLRKESALNRNAFALSSLQYYKDKGTKTKTRHSVRRSVSHPTSIPSHLLIKNIFHDPRAHGHQGIPRCWSCPTISLFIRSDLKPPLKQQASFDGNVYEVDVMRNVAAKQLSEDPSVHLLSRRNSLPLIHTTKPLVRGSKDESKQPPQSKKDTALTAAVPRKKVESNIANYMALSTAQCDASKNYENNISTEGIMMKVQKSLSDSNVCKKIVSNNRGVNYDPQIKSVKFCNEAALMGNILIKATEVSSFVGNDGLDYYHTNKKGTSGLKIVDTNDQQVIYDPQNKNNTFQLLEENTQHENSLKKIHEPEAEEAKPASFEKLTNTFNQKQVNRRHRANSDNKYVKDESELKLSFTRRRPRPSSVIYEEKSAHETSEAPDSQGYLPVHLYGEKSIPKTFQDQKVSTYRELLQPPAGQPPAGNCLPSRRMRYKQLQHL